MLKIYDLNKKDKSLDIVFVELGEDAYNTIKIIKFKNKICKVNKSYYDVTLKSYNPANGMITFEDTYSMLIETNTTTIEECMMNKEILI